jgi:hypothetical protein
MTHDIREMEMFFAELDGLLEPELKRVWLLGPGKTRNGARLSFISTRRHRSAKWRRRELQK